MSTGFWRGLRVSLSEVQQCLMRVSAVHQVQAVQPVRRAKTTCSPCSPYSKTPVCRKSDPSFHPKCSFSQFINGSRFKQFSQVAMPSRGAHRVLRLRKPPCTKNQLISMFLNPWARCNYLFERVQEFSVSNPINRFKKIIKVKKGMENC